jgi:methyl-accepting chemotaxis protein
MKLKLRTKLLLGFVGVALIGSVIGIIGMYGITTINNADSKLFQNITVPVSQLVEVTKDFELLRIANIKYASAANLAEAASFEKQIGPLEDNLKKLTDEFRGTLLTEKGKQIAASFDVALADYENDIAEIIRLVKDGKRDAAIALVNGSAANSAGKAAQALDSITADKILLAKETSDGNIKLTNSMVTLMLVVSILGLLISIVLALWISVWMISRPLMKISQTLASGSGQIGTASEQLSASSQEIANGATEQASSIEETSSSMEELSSMVKQNVVNAKESSVLADKSAESAQAGFGQMEKMLESMTEINRSSDKIKKVIKVIDDIAFQTNILALNAAVEAARAGEAGMGFAVVADEVKNLANRSAEAAKETSEMIEDSIKKTANGLELATKLAESFQEILKIGRKVSEMAREVESASRQQDTGIEQVNKAIVQFDEVVQANASSAEETASAAEELQSQVENLNEIVGNLLKLVTGQEAKTEVRTPVVHHKTEARRPEQLTHSSAQHLPPPRSRAREVSPDQVIPFEEDEEFKNLK